MPEKRHRSGNKELAVDEDLSGCTFRQKPLVIRPTYGTGIGNDSKNKRS